MSLIIGVTEWHTVRPVEGPTWTKSFFILDADNFSFTTTKKLIKNINVCSFDRIFKNVPIDGPPYSSHQQVLGYIGQNLYKTLFKPSHIGDEIILCALISRLNTKLFNFINLPYKINYQFNLVKVLHNDDIIKLLYILLTRFKLEYCSTMMWNPN